MKKQLVDDKATVATSGSLSYEYLEIRMGK
jgi:hypothetical protein